MPGLVTSEFGLVSRALPQPTPDGVEREQRLTRYGSTIIENIIPTKHALADEGSYFVANNGQASIGIQGSSGFTATKPCLSVYNADSQGNTSAKRIYLDYVYLINGTTATSNATSNTGIFVAITLDSQNGITGGTALTPVNTNMDMGTKSVALVSFGALTAPAVTAAARTVIGQRLLRAPVSATALTVANVDQFMLNFGFVDPMMAVPNAANAALEANMVGRTVNLPPIVLGPGQSAWIYIITLAGGAVTAGTFLPEIGWWER